MADPMPGLERAFEELYSVGLSGNLRIEAVIEGDRLMLRSRTRSPLELASRIEELLLSVVDHLHEDDF